MPQAAPYYRDLMRKWFGDIDLYAPSAFLLSRGYRIDEGRITPPVSSHKVSDEEGHCIIFLCDEWDYAWGVRPDRHT